MGKRGLYQILGLGAALLILFFGFGALLLLQDKGGFFSLLNVETILRQSMPIFVAALGMTLVIVAGGIDLSVGSVVAFVTVAVAWTLREGSPTWAAVLAGLAAGAVFGLLNGVLVSRLKVGPFIVTLATMLVARGAAKGLADNQKIDVPQTWITELLAVLDVDQKWRIFPNGVWIAIALAIATGFLLVRTRFGRYLVAVGSNEKAAHYSGIGVDRVKLGVYLAMGLFAGVAGLMSFARLEQGDPTTAQGFELNVIAAVVIGGASLSGGQGSILGTILGVLIMATIGAGCSQLGLANWIQEMITGGIIVISVLLDRLRVGRRQTG